MSTAGRKPAAPRKRGLRAEVPITRDAIVDTAIRMIDGGNGDFSMRALAKEMGVFPATLYWHVGDRSRLLGLVERRWLDGVTVPDDQPDWRAWMHESARRYRAQAHKHPNIARLVTNERARNVNSLTLPDALVGKLAELGFRDDLVHVYNALMGACQGFVAVELAAIPDKSAEWIENARSEMSSLDSDAFPNITRHFESLGDRALSIRWSDGADAPLDESFEYLVDMLLDAIQLRIDGRR